MKLPCTSVILLLAISLSASSSGRAGEAKPKETVKNEASAGPAPSIASNKSKPQYGSWGFDIAGADLKTKPGDDFFRFTNGAWLDRVKIPADKPAYRFAFPTAIPGQRPRP